MKVLQLAPFSGNIGDVFSYVGFQKEFRHYMDAQVEFTNVNIRDFYKNAHRRSFDAAFAEYVNTFDLFVIGGGQYFDVRWTDSCTGTTLALSDEFIDSIHIPVLVNAIGYYETAFTDGTAEIFERFEHFLQRILKKGWFVTVRNDGSIRRMAARYGKELIEQLSVVPDNGFYFDKDIVPFSTDGDKTTIGLMVSNDVFGNRETVDIENFNRQITVAVQEMIGARGWRVIFFLHAPQDLAVVCKILSGLSDIDVRNHIIVAPYNAQGEQAARTITSYYKKCDLCVAMRFHANVIAIENLIPTIGLSVRGLTSNDRIHGVYEALSLMEYFMPVDTHDPAIAKKLTEKALSVLDHAEEAVARERTAMECLLTEKDSYFGKIAAFRKRGD